MNNFPKLVLDFETYYGGKYSLKHMNTMEYVNHEDFTVQGVAVKWLNSEEPSEWISEDDVEEYLRTIEWDSTDLIAHNADFDAYILSQIYGIKPRFHYDTLAMSRGRFPGKSNSLAALVERLFPDDESIRKGTELIQAKGTKHLPPSLDEVIGQYACNDVDITEAAFNKLIIDYPEPELRIIDMVVRMFTQPRLMLNKERTVAFRDLSTATSNTKIKASDVPREVLSSNEKFAEYVAYTLQLPVPMKQGKKKTIPAFGKNDIAFQHLQAKHPEFKHIWDARLAAKSRLDITRSNKFLAGTNRDGTLSMPLKYYAAHTGRFGGGEKINPQNLKRGSELRKALVAPDGYMVVVADKSQIEARLTAWLAGCDELVEAFRNGRDVYSEFATEIYKRPITKSDTIERFVGKTCILGLGFGVGKAKLRSTLESGSQGPVVIIDEQKAASIVNTYRSKYREIPNLWRKLEDAMLWIQNDEFLGTKYGPVIAGHQKWILPNGMSMQYPELQGLSFYDARYKMRKTIWGGVITENLIQALARVNICEDMLAIEDWIRDNNVDAMISLQVHDEVICVCEESRAQELYQAMLNIMATPTHWAPDLPLKAEGGIAKEYSK
jgi:DNA polymerase